MYHDKNLRSHFFVQVRSGLEEVAGAEPQAAIDAGGAVRPGSVAPGELRW